MNAFVRALEAAGVHSPRDGDVGDVALTTSQVSAIYKSMQAESFEPTITEVDVIGDGSVSLRDLWVQFLPDICRQSKGNQQHMYNDGGNSSTSAMVFYLEEFLQYDPTRTGFVNLSDFVKGSNEAMRRTRFTEGLGETEMVKATLMKLLNEPSDWPVFGDGFDKEQFKAEADELAADYGFTMDGWMELLRLYHGFDSSPSLFELFNRFAYTDLRAQMVSGSKDAGYSNPVDIAEEATVTIISVSGARWPIMVSLQSALADLKAKVQAATSIPVSQQSLIFDGVILSDNTISLSTLGIGDGNEMNLVVRSETKIDYWKAWTYLLRHK